jgi:hypothetical protein
MPHEYREDQPAVNRHAKGLMQSLAQSATIFSDPQCFCEFERMGRVQ